MKNIVTIFEKRFPAFDELAYRDLTGLGIDAFPHRCIELIKRIRDAHIVKIDLAVHHKMVIDDMKFTSFVMLFGKVRNGTTAENIIGHRNLLKIENSIKLSYLKKQMNKGERSICITKNSCVPL